MSKIIIGEIEQAEQIVARMAAQLVAVGAVFVARYDSRDGWVIEITSA